MLDTGLAELALPLSDDVRERLVTLVELLAKWNRAYNLTAIRAPRDMLVKHVLDSLAVTGHVQGERVLDVGTGGGFPGLPLALAWPDRAFTLLDAAAKKIRFVARAAETLGLANVRAVHERIEAHDAGPGYTTVTCRAFSDLASIVRLAGPAVAPRGRILALKGRALSPGELQAAGSGWTALQQPVVVPLLTGERHVVTVTRAADPVPSGRSDA